MESNDVFFSLHAVALTLVVLVQCFLYEVRDELGICPLSGCQANTHHHHLPPIPVVLQKAQKPSERTCVCSLLVSICILKPR